MSMNLVIPCASKLLSSATVNRGPGAAAHAPSLKLRTTRSSVGSVWSRFTGKEPRSAEPARACGVLLLPQKGEELDPLPSAVSPSRPADCVPASFPSRAPRTPRQLFMVFRRGHKGQRHLFLRRDLCSPWVWGEERRAETQARPGHLFRSLARVPGVHHNNANKGVGGAP